MERKKKETAEKEKETKRNEKRKEKKNENYLLDDIRFPPKPHVVVGNFGPNLKSTQNCTYGKSFL
jgi:hypothetical protein